MKKLKTFKLLLGLVFQIKPLYIVYSLLNSLLELGGRLLSIFFFKYIIDSFLGAGQAQLLRPILAYLLAQLLLGLARALLRERLDILNSLLPQEIMYRFSKKSQGLAYSSLEDTDILDLRERAIFAVNNQSGLPSMLKIIEEGLGHLLSILGLSGLILQLNRGFGLVLFALAGLGFLVEIWRNRFNYRKYQEIIPINRKYSYYLSEAMADRNQKDFRIYNMSQLIMDEMKNFTEKTADWLAGLYRMENRFLSLNHLLAYLVQFFIYTYNALRLFTSSYGASISLGDFVANIRIGENIFQSFKELGRLMAEADRNLNMLEPFYDFMVLEEGRDQFGTKPVGDFQSLEFRQVSFSYPHSQRQILRDLSFKINRGDKISIVGVNNAGKSTIIKLICGFFLPDEGEILLNGQPIYDYNYQEYMDRIAVVFQDYRLFPFSIRENIAYKEGEEGRLEASLEKLGLGPMLEKLPQGLDSKLEKSIYDDAVDLSGGEKQKIAIARALYKKADLIILDEPTASLDPLAESEIYENFNRLVEDRTAIYISHRMSSSLFCDKILLIDQAGLVAFDTHHKLMAGDNKYRDLFLAQQKNFID